MMPSVSPAGLLTAALDYAARGWHVFPCRPGEKLPATPHGLLDATTDPERIQRYWTARPNANIAVACGASGLVVVDIDTKTPGADGTESWRTLRAELAIDDDTVTQTTPSGGEHLVYAAHACEDGAVVRNSAGKLGPGLDVRAAGGYILLPPSKLANGDYIWQVGYAPGECELLPLPPALLARLTEPTTPPSPNGRPASEGRIPEGERNSALATLAGAMRRRGANPDSILAALVAENAARCDPPLPDAEVATIAASVARYEPAPKAPRAKPALLTRTTEAALLRMSDVTPEAVRWLWPGRIPLGKLTILDGDPGLGKSLVSLDLAARVSRALPMPDGARGDLAGPAGVVLLSAEDDPADTIRPRLDAAGADCAGIVLLQTIEDVTRDPEGNETRKRRQPTLADVEAIHQAINLVEARLVIVDPVMAYAAGTDTHVDAEVRQVLAGLAALAQELRVAIVAVRHLNKSGGGNPLYRGGGSIAFIASARSGLLIAPDPEDAENKRRVLASTKCNLAEVPVALAYRIGVAEGIARVWWLGESEQTATTLLAVPSGDDHSAIGEARSFLQAILADAPVAVKNVLAEARGSGISEHTLRRARESLHVAINRQGFGPGSKVFWSLPVKQTSHTDTHTSTYLGGPPSMSCVQGMPCMDEDGEAL